MLSPIYLLYGDEPYFIDKISNVIQEKAIEEENKNFDEKILYVDKDLDVNSLICDVKSYPMVGHTQLIIVKNVEKLKKIEKLESYFLNPQISTILVLCFKKTITKAGKNKNWFKILKEKFVVFESKKLYPNQVINWLESYLKDKGYTATLKAKAMLIEF